MATNAYDESGLDLGVTIDDAILEQISGGAGGGDGDTTPACPLCKTAGRTDTMVRPLPFAGSMGKLFYCSCGAKIWKDGKLFK